MICLVNPQNGSCVLFTISRNSLCRGSSVVCLELFSILSLCWAIRHFPEFFSECKPIQSLAFAKTHKSGSTTLQNIILRYGFKNDLTLALPTKGWMCDQKIPFNATTMIKHYKDNPSHLFNLFVSHSFWNLKEVKSQL